MNIRNEHISTQQHIRVTRQYLDDVITPAFRDMLSKNLPQRTFSIAGKCIRIQSPTSSFVEFMTRAFTHQAELHNTTPDLTINLLDSAAAETLIPAPWHNPSHFFTQETESEEDNSFLGIFMNGEETLSLYDKNSRTAYLWVKDVNILPNYIAAAPLRTILHWYLSEHNIHLVHGALIGDGAQSILLTAKSGSGKSTTALACLMSSMKYLADDYGAIGSGKSPIAYSLYNSVKVLPDGLAIFPKLKEYIWNKEHYEQQKDDGKGIIFLKDTFPEHVQSSAPLTAILIPKITGGPTKIVSATKVETMLALIPSTIFQLPPSSTSKVEKLRSLIAQIPCYRLELGPPIQDVPQIIKDFLKSKPTI